MFVCKKVKHPVVITDLLSVVTILQFDGRRV
jgi:hypothetical protein